MKRRLGLFIGGCVAFWLGAVLLLCAVWPGQSQNLFLCSTVAFVLCLLPSLVTLIWSSWISRQDPDQLLLSVLGGTGLRMFFVLGGGLALYVFLPLLRQQPLMFWLWILVLYLVTLTLEMVVLVRSTAPRQPSHAPEKTASVSK